MKSFKIREGKVVIDGILYGETPQPNPIPGKWGRIASINVGGTQLFPLSGEFNDGTPVVEPFKRTKKTELVEAPMSLDGKPLKKKAGKFTLNPNR